MISIAPKNDYSDIKKSAVTKSSNGLSAVTSTGRSGCFFVSRETVTGNAGPHGPRSMNRNTFAPFACHLSGPNAAVIALSYSIPSLLAYVL